MRYKAIIFDMDGTLLNTLTGLGSSANRVLATGNYPQHKIEDYRYFVGQGAEKLIESILPKNRRSEKNIRDCLNSFIDDYTANWRDEAEPYDKIPEMLDILTGQGIRLAILSNKPHNLTLKCAEELLAEWRFEKIFGQRDGVPKKPNPAGALEIAEQMELLPGDFLYVGDTGIDMETANNAGMFAVGVLWGFRSRDELLKTGASVLLKTPMDILRQIRV